MPTDTPKDLEELIARLGTVLDLLETLLKVRETSPLTLRIDEMMQVLARIADALEISTQNAPDLTPIAARMVQVEMQMEVLMQTVEEIRDWLIAPVETAGQSD